MAWIRLDDDYVHHAKFTALSHQAFRLWHEGMAYCRKMLTDGQISFKAAKAFRYYSKAGAKELTTPEHPGAAPLWECEPDCYRVHDYLDWNPTSEEERADRDGAKLRMRAYRGRVKLPPVTVHVTPSVTANVTPRVTPIVPGEGKGKDLLLQEKGEFPRQVSRLEAPPTNLDLRAGDLLQHYGELFALHQLGAKYQYRPHLDLPKAMRLVQTWDDDGRLEKLAILVLTTDDEWISGTDRGFSIFASKASWADVKLTEWEATHGKAVSA